MKYVHHIKTQPKYSRGIKDITETSLSNIHTCCQSQLIRECFEGIRECNSVMVTKLTLGLEQLTQIDSIDDFVNNLDDIVLNGIHSKDN